ncbi:MAG: pyridoxamine 5'-phosphate oxidase family protein [Bacteroidetes bacterium]|nr:MAG: pyridoxamine 5'-phosphate oxidase family protein [Bacteroidota bacterium]
MEEFPRSPRNRVRRLPKRGHYDRRTIYAILDAGFLAHVGFCIEGQPYVIPTAYGREGDVLYIHGASTSRMLGHLEQGHPLCLSVTHLDGLVLARSAFNHSMNYRSVVVFGRATLVEGAEKLRALEVISEQILKGRWAEVRQPSEKELRATTVLKIPMEEASAKIRSGPPGDEKADYALPVWAGVVPLERVWAAPQPDPLLAAGIPLADSVRRLLEGGESEENDTAD